MIALLAALACSPSGQIDIDGNGSGNGGGDDTGVTDTGEEQVEPHGAAGEYTGQLGWMLPDAWDGWVVCTMEIDVTVDDEGAFSASQDCIYKEDGDEWTLPVSLEGSLDDDGDASGTITFDTWEQIDREWQINETEAELEGSSKGDELILTWESESEIGRDDYELEGWVELRR
jgi:hypothetical protein